MILELAGIEDEDAEKLESLKDDLIKLARSTAKKQEVMLARVGTSFQTQLKKGDYYCLSLYDPQGFVIKINEDIVNLEREYASKCVERYRKESNSTTNNKEYKTANKKMGIMNFIR